MNKGIFQEFLDVYKEIEREIKEAEKKSSNSGNTINRNGSNRSRNRRRRFNKAGSLSYGQVDPKKKKFQATNHSRNTRSKAGEGESQTTDYMERAKSLRDLESNIENKATFIGSRGTDSRREGVEGDFEGVVLERFKQDMSGKASASLKNEKLSISDSNTDKINQELKDIVRSLKVEDRSKNARKAFIYRTIFDRKF